MRKEQPASHEIRNIRVTLSHIIFYVCFTEAYKRRSCTLLGVLLYDTSFSVFKCFNPASEKICYMTYMYRLTEKIFAMNLYVQKVYELMHLNF